MKPKYSKRRCAVQRLLLCLGVWSNKPTQLCAFIALL